MNSPLISVIVPVYNCEKYLERCVRSLQTQTYDNLEILLVDDGSRDGSGTLCDGLAREDARIRVIHKENGGVSSARNCGLNAMTGQYCAFVDADDYVDPRLIQTLYLACQNGIQLAACGFLSCAPEEQPKMAQEIPEPRHFSPHQDFCFSHHYFYPAVWGKLYASSLVEHIRFDTDIYIGEDALFFARAVRQTDKMAYVDAPLYIYIQYPQSANHGSYTTKRMTEIAAWERITSEFSGWPQQVLQDCQARLGAAYFAGVRCIYGEGNSSTADPKVYLKEVRRLRPAVMCSCLPTGYKLGYTLMCLCPGAYMAVYRLLKKK